MGNDEMDKTTPCTDASDSGIGARRPNQNMPAMRAYAQQIQEPADDAWEIRKRAEDKLGGLSACP